MITLAAIAGAHGVTGEVRLKLFAADIDSLKRHRQFNQGRLSLTAIRPHKGMAIARFAEIADRNAAEALRGLALAVPRSALPALDPGEYYHADLVGLACVDPEGTVLGRVVGVENFGAGDILEIERPDGRRFMVPLRPEAVPEWDAARAVISPGYAEV